MVSEKMITKNKSEGYRIINSEEKLYSKRFHLVAIMFILINTVGTLPFLEYYSLSTWFTVSQDHYFTWGLNLKKQPLELLYASIGYSFVHCGLTHLLYTAFLITLFVMPLERKVSAKEVVCVYIISSIMVPLLILIIFFPLQNLFWFNTQYLLFSEEYFVGASLPAWAVAGSLAYYSKNDRKYWAMVVLMLLLPLGYKLVITKLDRFVSDIAHLSAWFFGLSLTCLLSTFKGGNLK
ncbi:MAG: rhomboid family intramembrane serine protease [Candidatus Kariarchaeaceae archaeon]